MEISYDLRVISACKPITARVKIILDTLNTEKLKQENTRTQRNMQHSINGNYFLCPI